MFGKYGRILVENGLVPVDRRSTDGSPDPVMEPAWGRMSPL